MTPADHAGKSHEFRVRSRAENARERLLRDWYGKGLASREIEANQKREQAVGSLVDELLRSWNREDRIILRKLMDRWAEIVGAEFQKHTLPLGIERKVLLVEVFNAVIAFKLKGPEAKRTLLEHVKEVAGDEVDDIRFVAGGRSSTRPG